MAETVLVTGACGSIGPFAVRELLEKGYDVRLTDLPGVDFRWAEGLGCEFRPADLLNPAQAQEAMKGVDVVVHTAARMNMYMTRPEYELANFRVTVNACEAAARQGVRRFIHYSTADAYGPPISNPVDETHPFHPVGLYGTTKAFGEQAAMRCYREKGLPISVIRPSMVYGPACAYVMGALLGLPAIIREAGVESLPIFKQGFRANLINVEDVAAASVFLIGKDEAIGEAYNVADDSVVPFTDVLELAFNSVGVRCNKVLPISPSAVAAVMRVGAHLPRAFFAACTTLVQRRWDAIVCKYGLRPLLTPRLDPGFTTFGRADYIFDNSKLKSLGYELRHPDVREGWKQSVRWYVENEWIPPYEPVE